VHLLLSVEMEFGRNSPKVIRVIFRPFLLSSPACRPLPAAGFFPPAWSWVHFSGVSA
jgi:hypothetical protein